MAILALQGFGQFLEPALVFIGTCNNLIISIMRKFYVSDSQRFSLFRPSIARFLGVFKSSPFQHFLRADGMIDF